MTGKVSKQKLSKNYASEHRAAEKTPAVQGNETANLKQQILKESEKIANTVLK